MQNSLKHFPKLNLYKNSTGTVKFNSQTLIATSYDHWTFVKPSGKKNTVIFNTYRYSVTTSSHQRVVRRLLEELNINIEFVDQSDSL